MLVEPAASSMADELRRLAGHEPDGCHVLRLDETSDADRELACWPAERLDHILVYRAGRQLGSRHAHELIRLLRPGGTLLNVDRRPCFDFLEACTAHGLIPGIHLRRTFGRCQAAGRMSWFDCLSDCLPPGGRLEGGRPGAWHINCYHKSGRRANRCWPTIDGQAALHRKVSVVIPCYNEQANLNALLSGLRDCLGDCLLEIIPVDDNSQDGTREVLQQWAAEDSRIRPVWRSPPRGVGRALAAGYAAARGEYLLAMDADFLHLLPQVAQMLEAAASGADVVYGTRFIAGSYLRRYPIAKLLANRTFHWLARWLLGFPLVDVTNNLKVLHRDTLRQLHLTRGGFAANAEIGIQPYLFQRTVVTVAVPWSGREPGMGPSSFRLLSNASDYAGVLWHAFLARRLGRGPYRQPARPSPDNWESPSPC